MHTVLALQHSVGIFAVYLQANRLDARCITRCLPELGDFVVVRLCPHDVHAGKHRSPIARLGATCPGVDLKYSTQFVLLLVEGGTELYFIQGGLRLGVLGVHFFFRGLAHFLEL